MKTTTRLAPLFAALIATLAAAPAFAQTSAAATQMTTRNLKQQNRIEQGLQSGALNTREAGRLERQEARVNQMEARALRDGTVSAQEQSRINAAQNQVSRDIRREKHDAQLGNPASASSQRMQADVQRNANQQSRILAGQQSGQLSAGETAQLQRGQARVERRQARAAADGHVGAREQARVQGAEDHQSQRIRTKKHNARTAG